MEKRKVEQLLALLKEFEQANPQFTPEQLGVVLSAQGLADEWLDELQELRNDKIRADYDD